MEQVMNKIKDKVTVIIRTRNEERWVGHAIQSILDLIYKPEIIIIDNNSTDETLNIVGYFIQDPILKGNNKNYTDIKIHKISQYTPGKSINLGVKKARNSIVMIMSAHCQLKKMNLKKHIKDLKKYACIFGKQNPIYQGKNITKRYIWSHFKDKEKINMFSEFENRYFLHNALAIYNKKFLTKYPFNEKLVGKEDREWVNNIIKKKQLTLYDPSLEAIHHYTPDGNTWKGIE